MFTAKQIENLKPKDKPYQVREGKGFGIRVFPSGEKVWFYAYKFHGRQRMMTLGPYPELKLKDAREEFEENRTLLKKGTDPLAAKHEERQEPIVKEVVDLYIERAQKKGMRSLKEERRMLTKYVPKDWELRKVKTIRRGEIRDVVERLADTAPQMANQFQKALHRFFAFCVDREYVEYNPCASMSKPAPTASKDRWLSEEEIRDLWEKLDTAGMTEEVKRALKLILVTAQRPGEVVGMRFDHIQGRWWTIPGEYAKNGLAHRVYLTDLALEIIGQGEGSVFPSPKPRSGRSSLHRNSLSHAASLNDHLGLSRWTPHDLRRTAASHMTSAGISRFVVGLILNHSDKSITKVYDRNSYDKEKQVALEAWSRKLKNIVEGQGRDNVIQMVK